MLKCELGGGGEGGGERESGYRVGWGLLIENTVREVRRVGAKSERHHIY